jgi:diguanylate cyclase (GGDEF)-like protein
MSNDKPRILVVDDTPDNLHLLAEILGEDYEVLIATGGQRALELAHRTNQRPDLILLDIMMPGMSGFETCRQLKESDATRDIPIIFVTAKDGQEDEARGLSLGAVDYITKPFHLSIVVARVRNHITLKLKSDRLERHANLDGLTDIANRRRFDETLGKEWLRAIRDERELGLILMDVDCFKQFNDQYGHGEGDECLRRLARALQGALSRPGDLLARYGGEEFAVILPDTGEEGVRNIGLRLLGAVSGLRIPHRGNTTAGCVTLSIGCATTRPDREKNPRQLIDSADALLYQAKEAGRNCMRAGTL